MYNKDQLKILVCNMREYIRYYGYTSADDDSLNRLTRYFRYDFYLDNEEEIHEEYGELFGFVTQNEKMAEQFGSLNEEIKDERGYVFG